MFEGNCARTLSMIMDIKYISNTLSHCGRQKFKMQSSSPDSNPSSSSLIYNDSGYITHINHEIQSLSTNSEPSMEASEEVSLHSRQGEPPATLHTTSSVYFCEDAVFDEPKLEGPPLLCDNSNNYEEFSSLIKFSLEDTSSSYITNDAYLRDENKYSSDFGDYTNDRVSEKVASKEEESSTILQYLNTDSLSSYSSMNPSQSICVSEVHDRQSIISQAVEQCLTISISQNNETTSEHTFNESSNTTLCSLDNVNRNNTPDTSQSTVFEQSEPNTMCSFSSKLTNCTPTKTFINTVNPDLSPELFSDDDEPLSETSIATENLSITQKSFTQDEDMMKNDRKLLKHLQENLSGVPPPPSVTILQLTAADMLNKINNNRHLFLMDREKSDNKCDKSLLIVNTKDEVDNSVWPDILAYRYHGLHYNRSKVSEDLEHYCTKYAARYVGAETASSCTVWSTMAPNSATKRRNARLRWGIKSPGRRLSHLARRRITFSSSNLQQAGTSLSVIGNSSGARQLMIDARKSALLQKRKSPRKSPWKRSPRKSPQKRVKTPSSSTKKRAVRRLTLGPDDDAKPGTSKASSTKRALFQSPDHTRSTISSTDQFLQKNKSKRALFMSPNKNSPSKTGACDKKRKRADEDCHPSKFPRSLSFDVHHSSALNEAANGGSLQRRNSEVIIRPNTSKGELSDLHRKKLLWAVSEALRAQQISMSHPQFRTYASILCKVIKYLMPDLLSNGPRQPGSTSDRMLRIARQHCYAVTRGKSFEEIMQLAKETSASLKNLKPPTGYVSLEQARAAQAKNVLQDKVMNIESNSAKKRSPVQVKVDTKIDENNRLRNIRRQIIFDDTEITKSCNPHR